jgi:beta-galactosidase
MVKAGSSLNGLFAATFFTIASSNLSAADTSRPRERLRLDSGWRWKKLPNVNDSKLAELKTNFDDSTREAANPQSDSGPLGEREQAVFRVKIQMSKQDLAARAVELRGGKIDEDGWVYVNGKLAGESPDWQVPAVIDVKPFLHPGENVIAVAVANYGGPGGLNKGVTLEFQEKIVASAWQRDVFNGLAQIIIQSTREPGEIKLTASVDGLSPATASVSSQPCTFRPAAP